MAIARTLLLAVALLAAGASAAADGVRLQWFGQSAVKLTSPGGKVIVIDPFILNNPVLPESLRDLERIGPVDLILVTHAHGDHWGDTAELARMTGAPVGLNADFGNTVRTLGVLPGKQLIRFNKSGPIQPLGEGITITMVHAEHSSDFVHESAVYPGGEPAGYIIEFEDGFSIYHMGDTGVFGDMAWIGDYYDPDVALVPIGGHFTMDPEHAAFAIDQYVDPEIAIPIHYGTFPPLKGTPEQFVDALGDSPVEVVTMTPGSSRTFGD
ncbi:MAG: metal-dependent hydrolase [Halofilum sp. (in: g-proteobacteria)]|nr:metal-dependent hydrolase [Halofilum sp. (in: g-proteobacteria)]